jgi:hypothetical protein
MTPAQFIFGFALLGFGTAATTGLCIALGIVGVRHDVSEYSLLSVGMSLLASLVAFMCQWSVGMLFSLSAILMQRLGYPELPALAMSLILSGGVSLAVAYLVPRWVLGQVSRIGEDDSDGASGERRDVDHFVSGLTD